MKIFIKSIVPPIFTNIYRKIRKSRLGYDGNYASWKEALAYSTGYDSDLILDKVCSALLKVKSGEAVYERDSVLFDNIEYSFPVLAVLLRAAVANKGKLNVLDFGGSLGSTYFQCREFLSAVNPLTWHIVEQEKFINLGKELFETKELKFFSSIEESVKRKQPDVILLSSVLQYLQNPFEVLKMTIESGSRYMVIDRTPFSTIEKDILCVQHVPSQIYVASYPCWIFSEVNFKRYMLERFELIADFNTEDGGGQAGNVPFTFKGMILERH